MLEILKLLLAFKSDPNQRGINDYTPLHMAVSEHNLRAVELLLQASADPRLRTRIDDCETPREMAEKGGLPRLQSCSPKWRQEGHKGHEGKTKIIEPPRRQDAKKIKSGDTEDTEDTEEKQRNTNH